MTELLHFSCGTYTVSACVGALPSMYSAMYSAFVKHAVLNEEVEIHSGDGTALFFAVKSRSRNWPELVAALRFAPGAEAGFNPGFLLLPESHLLFVGAGTCLLAYQLSSVRRLWEDVADCGFWEWPRHGDIVLMSAELELAAWDVGGRKLWSTFVEPPWSYEIHGDRLELDVMGRKSSFVANLGPGPPPSI